jgi:hypothetical protein
MRTPELRDIAAIAEVVGTLGVIVSLVFVVYTIDKNTAEVRATHSNSVFNANREVELAVASDAEWSRIIAERRSQKLLSSSAEEFRYDQYLVISMSVWEQLFSRYQDEQIDQDIFDSWNGYYKEWTKRHVTRDDWDRIRWQFTDVDIEFIDHVTGAILIDRRN